LFFALKISVGIVSVGGGTCGRGKVNGGDESDGKWLMGFIYN
jgi:hypothetical protein